MESVSNIGWHKRSRMMIAVGCYDIVLGSVAGFICIWGALGLIRDPSAALVLVLVVPTAAFSLYLPLGIGLLKRKASARKVCSVLSLVIIISNVLIVRPLIYIAHPMTMLRYSLQYCWPAILVLPNVALLFGKKTNA